jgi:ubiquinone/menaquinone biosynthesis C-methylase UbiE
MIFGLDTDGGEAPVELTKRFMDKTPFVWLTLNIPMPFGGTPLFEEQRQAGRILEEMPFGFYYAPYTVTTIKNYDPKSYYRRLIEMFEYCSSGAMLRRRLKMRNTPTGCLIDVARTLSVRAELREYRRILRELESDDDLCRFHEGMRVPLPAFYRAEYDRQLGRHACLLDDEERRPVLEQEPPATVAVRPAPRTAATITDHPSAPTSEPTASRCDPAISDRRIAVCRRAHDCGCRARRGETQVASGEVVDLLGGCLGVDRDGIEATSKACNPYTWFAALHESAWHTAVDFRAAAIPSVVGGSGDGQRTSPRGRRLSRFGHQSVPRSGWDLPCLPPAGVGAVHRRRARPVRCRWHKASPRSDSSPPPGPLSMTAESAPKLDLDSEWLARDYEEVSATRQFESGKDLLARLGIAPAERVLDVGCGTGLLARHLADLVGPAGMVLGLYPLPRRIELAREKTRPNLAFDVGDANDLSTLAQSSFDVVVLNAVFHWLPEKTGPLRQFARVLRRGGRLGISTGLKGYRTPLQEAMMAALREPPFDAHSRARDSIVFRVDTVQMRALLEASGFEPARVEVVETEQRFPSAETALRYSDASSFGNVFAHLPAELRPQALAHVLRRLGEVVGPGGLVQKGRRLIAIGSRR